VEGNDLAMDVLPGDVVVGVIVEISSKSVERRWRKKRT
jgi:hypothetical protein